MSWLMGVARGLMLPEHKGRQDECIAAGTDAPFERSGQKRLVAICALLNRRRN
jgi:hypothetical protein